MSYKLIEKNKDYLIVNKPAGLLTHGAGHIKEKSLVNFLLADYPELAGVGEDNFRPGIMHRLDKLASGLMVVALNNESFFDLKKQFQERTISKYYTALVFGRIISEESEINFPIMRSPKGYKMVALPLTKHGEANFDGRNAKTKFEIIKKYINYTLLRVKTETGRTHQVRCHFAAYGHPLVGDNLYGTRKTKLKNKKINLERIFLVADELGFTNLEGERKKYKIKLPKELEKFLEIVK